MTGSIEVSTDGSIVTLVISRPDKLNSVTKSMLSDFSEKVEQYTNDPEVTAIIFTGAGDRAFSAGFDMDTVKGLKGQDREDFFKTLEDIIRVIRTAKSCLTLAAVNGYAVGFGSIVAVACDFRFFSEDAKLRLPEVQLSIFPGAGATSNLLHLVGPSHAKDILLTGRSIPAREAKVMGLANRVYPKDELMSQAKEFLKELLEKDCRILLNTKNLIDAMTGKDIGDAAELEAAYLEEWLLNEADEE
ncbi:MAG: enoyl-CoA hydratase/isomerase family protein [Promethearchaeia archaeon]